jgi:putative glutamine amidotransferase
VQHLPDVVGSTKYNLGRGEFNSIPVVVDRDTQLSDLVGHTVDAKVYHHQSLDRVADGLLVSARSGDGIIQAVELETVPFGVAVQWHPEESQDDIRLFSGLVDAARVYAASSVPQRR